MMNLSFDVHTAIVYPALSGALILPLNILLPRILIVT